MNREDIKTVVKAEMGGVLAINPEDWRGYLEGLAKHFNITKEEAKEIALEALNELPPIDW